MYTNAEEEGKIGVDPTGLPVSPSVNFKALDDIFSDVSAESYRVIQLALQDKNDNALKSNIIDTVANCYNNAVNYGKKNRNKKISIPECLSVVECAALEHAFPMYRLEFTNKANNNHGYSAAMRRLETQVCLDRLKVTTDSKPMLGYDASVVDIGGNYSHYFMKDYTSVHCCAPNHLIRDVSRNVVRKIDLANYINSTVLSINQKNLAEQINSLKNKHDVTPFLCHNLSQECNITSPNGIAIHSLYDITQTELADIFEKKNMYICYATMIFDPDILIKTSGEIDRINARWDYKSKDKISFSFRSDSSLVYDHDVSTYLSWFINPIITSKSRKTSCMVEMMENVDGVQFLRIVRLDNVQKQRTELGHNLWFDKYKNTYRIVMYTMNYDKYVENSDFKNSNMPEFEGELALKTRQLKQLAEKDEYTIQRYDEGYVSNQYLKESGLFEHVFFCDKELVDAGMDYAFGIAENASKFKPQHIFLYLQSYATKLFSGKEVIRRCKRVDPVLLYDLSLAIYLYIYDAKYRMGKSLQMLLEDINFNRTLSNAGLFKKLIMTRPAHNIKKGFFDKWLYKAKRSDFQPKALITKVDEKCLLRINKVVPKAYNKLGSLSLPIPECMQELLIPDIDNLVREAIKDRFQVDLYVPDVEIDYINVASAVIDLRQHISKFDDDIYSQYIQNYKSKNFEIVKGEYKNNSYIKLKQMNLNLYGKVLDLCSGPGGFLTYYMENNLLFDFHYYKNPKGMQLYKPFIGKQLNLDNGDLLNTQDYAHLDSVSKMYDWVTADGCVENNSKNNPKLAKVCADLALKHLKRGGNFLLKLIEIGELRNYSLVHSLASKFRTFSLLKPVNSMFLNSEVYAVFEGYNLGCSKDVDQQIAKYYSDLEDKYHKTICDLRNLVDADQDTVLMGVQLKESINSSCLEEKQNFYKNNVGIDTDNTGSKHSDHISIRSNDIIPLCSYNYPSSIDSDSDLDVGPVSNYVAIGSSSSTESYEGCFCKNQSKRLLCNKSDISNVGLKLNARIRVAETEVEIHDSVVPTASGTRRLNGCNALIDSTNVCLEEEDYCNQYRKGITTDEDKVTDLTVIESNEVTITEVAIDRGESNESSNLSALCCDRSVGDRNSGIEASVDSDLTSVSEKQRKKKNIARRRKRKIKKQKERECSGKSMRLQTPLDSNNDCDNDVECKNSKVNVIGANSIDCVSMSADSENEAYFDVGETLERVNSFKIFKVQPDGDCCFKAVTYPFLIDNPRNLLRSARDKLIKSLSPMLLKDLDEELKDKNWGGLAVLQLYSLRFSSRITVYKNKPDSQLDGSAVSCDEVIADIFHPNYLYHIHLSYNGCHYDFLYKTKSKVLLRNFYYMDVDILETYLKVFNGFDTLKLVPGYFTDCKANLFSLNQLAYEYIDEDVLVRYLSKVQSSEFYLICSYIYLKTDYIFRLLSKLNSHYQIKFIHLMKSNNLILCCSKSTVHQMITRDHISSAIDHSKNCKSFSSGNKDRVYYSKDQINYYICKHSIFSNITSLLNLSRLLPEYIITIRDIKEEIWDREESYIKCGDKHLDIFVAFDDLGVMKDADKIILKLNDIDIKGIIKTFKVVVQVKVKFDVVPILKFLASMGKISVVGGEGFEDPVKRMKPSFKPEIDSVTAIYNSMVEIRDVWRVTKSEIENSLIKVFKLVVNNYCNQHTYIEVADKSFGLIDIKTKSFVIKPMLLKESYEKYFYIDENDSCQFVSGDYIKNGQLNLKYSESEHRFLAFNKNTYIMNDEKMYDTIKSVVIDPGLINFSVKVVEGVPGAGKTQHILDHHDSESPRHLVVTATKEAAMDFKCRLANKLRYPERYRTCDSFLVNYKNEDYDVVWADEGLMKHVGELLWIAFLSRCKTLYIYGDSAQIPYFNREGLRISRSSYKARIEVEKEFLPVTRRCPLDVCNILSEMKGSDNKRFYNCVVKTTNPVKRSLNFKRILTKIELERLGLKNKQCLTFQQAEKADLIDFGFTKVNTIGEYQGKQNSEIYLIRLRDKDIDLYKDYNQILVAISRHTKAFYYYSVVEDTLSQIIKASQLKSNSELLSHLKINGGGIDVKLTDRVDSFIQYPDYVTYLLPETVLLTPNIVKHYDVKRKNNNFNFVPNFISSHGHYGKVSLRPVAVELESTNYLSQYTEDTAEYFTPSYEPNAMFVIQNYFDNLRPGSSVVSNRFDKYIFEYVDDLKVSSDKFRISNVANVVHFKDYLTSNLRTSCPAFFPSTQKQILKAFAERNGGVPELQGRISETSVVENLTDRFLHTYIEDIQLLKVFSNNKLTINVESMDNWLLSQNAATMQQLLSDPGFSIFDKYLNSFQYMLKRMAKPNLDPQPESKFSSPQAIAFQEKYLNAVFCPLVRDMKHRLLSVLKRNKIIYCDMAPKDLETIMNHRFPVCMLGREYKRFYELDFSKYDKSQNYLALAFEVKMMELLGFPEDLIPLWIYIHASSYLRNFPNKFKAEVTYQRKSGDAMTFFGNTLYLMASMCFLLDLDDAFCVFSGDDSIVFSKSAIDVVKTIQDFSNIFNLETKLLDFDFPYFCSKFLLPVNDTWKFVPDLLKLIIKLGRCDLVDKVHAEEYKKSLVDTVSVLNDIRLYPYIDYAMRNRYNTDMSCIAVCSALYWIINDQDQYDNLYYISDGDELFRKYNIRPSVDI